MRRRTQRFVDRSSAGRELALTLRQHVRGPVRVLGLPRGGVPVAYEIAQILQAPLDVLVVRKIGLPNQPELAIGALAGGEVVREPGAENWVSSRDFARLAREQAAELARRENTYRAGQAPLDLKQQRVILVDDGLATGCSMLAAMRAARKAGASAVMVAAPVAADEAAALVRAEADAFFALEIPANLSSIGEWYQDFEQLTDEEVCNLLALSREALCISRTVAGVPAQLT